MVKDKIKFTFFIVGLFAIIFAGVSWWLSKTFGKIHFSELIWLVNISSLIEYDEDIVRHFFQWTSLCLAACILWFTLLYKRSQYIYIYSRIKVPFFEKLSPQLIDLVLYMSIFVISIYSFTNFYSKFFVEYSVESEVRHIIERNKTDFTQFYNSTGFTDPQGYIAHGGGVGEFTYTNSYEAVIDSIQRGYKFIELDLLITHDNIIIGGHDWAHFKTLIDYSDHDDSPLLYKEIKDKKINGKYTVLSSKEICSIMEKYPNFYLVTDKIRNYKLLLEQIPYPDKLIVEVFGYNDYKNALEAGIKYPALCRCNETATVAGLNKVLIYKIPMITSGTHELQKPDRYDKYKELHEKGVVVFFFGWPKEGEVSFIRKNMGKIFSKFYTNIDYEKIIQENIE